MTKEQLKFFAWYSGDSEEDIQEAWVLWERFNNIKPPKPIEINKNNHISDEWVDRNCDCNGNCYSDADPGL